MILNFQKKLYNFEIRDLLKKKNWVSIFYIVCTTEPPKVTFIEGVAGLCAGTVQWYTPIISLNICYPLQKEISIGTTGKVLFCCWHIHLLNSNFWSNENYRPQKFHFHGKSPLKRVYRFFFQVCLKFLK